MYKLLVTDLDGTLLNDEKGISREDVASINKLKNKNIKFSVFTGRSLVSAREYLNELKPNMPVALNNGAFLYNCDTEETVYKTHLKSETAIKLYRQGKKTGLNPILFSDFFNEKYMIIENKFWDDTHSFHRYFIHNKDRIVFVDSIEEYLKERAYIVQLVFMGNKYRVKEFMEIHQDLKDISMVYSTEINETVFFEILGSEVSKGKMLSKLMESFQILPEEVIYVGDNYNDLCAMNLVGMPVSPSNASGEIKKISKYTAPSNNDSPLTGVIKHFFPGII